MRMAAILRLGLAGVEGLRESCSFKARRWLTAPETRTQFRQIPALLANLSVSPHPTFSLKSKG